MKEPPDQGHTAHRGARDTVGRPSAGDDAAGTPVPAVGIGPGSPAHRTARANQIIDDADALIGFRSVLEYLGDGLPAAVFPCDYGNQATQIERFAGRVHDGDAGAIAAMGDPSVSGRQFVDRVADALDRPVRIVPGISSVQVAAARAGIALEETTIVSLHRRGPLERDLARLRRDVCRRHLIVLPHPTEWHPPAIAEHLLSMGAPATLETAVFEHLTLPEAATTRQSLQALAADRDDPAAGYADMAVVCILSRKLP